MNITPKDLKTPMALLTWTTRQSEITKLEKHIIAKIGMKPNHAMALIHLLETDNVPRTGCHLAAELDGDIYEAAVKTLKIGGYFERNRDGKRYLVKATAEGLAKAKQMREDIEKLITKITKPR